MTTIYRGRNEGTDTTGPHTVTVQRDGQGERPLVHQVHHSPDGFSWGYEGSGPADLARSILTDHLGRIPAPRLYQRFKRAFVARWPAGSPWQITDDGIEAFLGEALMRRALLECPTCGFEIAALKGGDTDLNVDCTNPRHYQPRRA